MKRNFTSITLCAILLTLSVSAHAQQTGKVFRIGFLDSSTASGMAPLIDAFRQEMRKLGWIEGKNLTIEYRFAEQKNERLPELATELVRRPVDLIVVTGGAAALAAKSATTAIPIVTTSATDPVGTGLVASLARPGGNVTGFTALSMGVNTKRLEILKDAVPKLITVGLLRGSGSGPIALQLKELRNGASALKLTLEEIETQLDPKSLESAFQTAKQKRVGAMLTTAGRNFFAERKRIVEHAGKYRLPAIYPSKEYVEVGGLMYYGVDEADRSRTAAGYVDRILKGAKPADLPVQQPMKFEFIISLKAAKQIGLKMPLNVLERANQVIR